jgi:4-hydroxy-tetrahydrodipicolinate synthase
VKSDLHWDHLLRLLKHPNIVVLKESTTRVGQVAQVLAAQPDAAVMCCDSPNLGWWCRPCRSAGMARRT